MLGRLIKKEILEHLMSLRFAIACVLCLIVILTSLLVRSQDYMQRLDDHNQDKAMEKTRLDRVPQPWRFYWGGMKVMRDPNPLRVFIRGVESDNAVVRASGQDDLQPVIPNIQNTSASLFLSLDLVMFVGVIMSLMAVVFGYDAICGEKERGTLRLTLSYSLPRHLVLLSKWIGGYVTLILPFLLTVLVGAAIVMFQAQVGLAAEHWLQLLAIIGLAMLYLACIFTLSIFVSTMTAHATTSIMLLLSMWVVLVLAVPNLGPHVAQVFLPSPSVDDVVKERQATAQDMLVKGVDEPLKVYDKQNGLPTPWWSINWGDPAQRVKVFKHWLYEWELRKKTRLAIIDRLDHIDQEVARKVQAQADLNRWISRVSPFSCFSLGTIELSDTGLMQNERYSQQLHKFHRTLAEYSLDECIAATKQEIDTGRYEGPWFKTRKPLPQFAYVAPQAGEYFQAVAFDVGILAAATVVLFMLAYTRFLRYDVR